MNLTVQIEQDGSSRTFAATGDGEVVVAAFRCWLAGYPAPVDADALDVSAELLLVAAEALRRKTTAINEAAAREALLAEALGITDQKKPTKGVPS